MVDTARVNWIDYSNEGASMGLTVPDLANANLVAQQALVQTVITELDPINTGLILSYAMVIEANGSAIPSADPLSHVANTWLVNYIDVTQFLDPPTDSVANPGFGKAFVSTWPCADPSGTHLVDNEDFADLADPDVAAFVTAFESTFKSPYGGDVQVVRIDYSGKDI